LLDRISNSVKYLQVLFFVSIDTTELYAHYVSCITFHYHCCNSNIVKPINLPEQMLLLVSRNSESEVINLSLILAVLKAR